MEVVIDKIRAGQLQVGDYINGLRVNELDSQGFANSILVYIGQNKAELWYHNTDMIIVHRPVYFYCSLGYDMRG